MLATASTWTGCTANSSPAASAARSPLQRRASQATATLAPACHAPFTAGGEQVIAKNVEHRRHPVAPRDLLPLGVGAAAVRDGQLPDARARLRQPRRQLDLDPEPSRRERQLLQ